MLQKLGSEEHVCQLRDSVGSEREGKMKGSCLCALFKVKAGV